MQLDKYQHVIFFSNFILSCNNMGKIFHTGQGNHWTLHRSFLIFLRDDKAGNEYNQGEETCGEV